LIARYLNPVWEVTNVFFVFFFVGMVGFFPDSAMYFGTVLLLPASIALILLSIRGGFYAFENYGPDTKLPWLALYGLAGDRKSTRLNSSHVSISYAVFCVKK